MGISREIIHRRSINRLKPAWDQHQAFLKIEDQSFRSFERSYVRYRIVFKEKLMGAIELYNGYYYTGKLSQLIGQLVHPVGGKGMDTEGG